MDRVLQRLVVFTLASLLAVGLGYSYLHEDPQVAKFQPSVQNE